MTTNTTSNLFPVGDALLGRVIDSSGAPLDGGAPIDAARQLPIDQPGGADAAPLPDQLLETGIKVIDLYAPLVRGGTIPIMAGAGVGKIVVSLELLQRIATRQGGCAVMAFLDHPPYGMVEMAADLRGSGVDRQAALVVGQQDDPQASRDRVGLAALTLAEHYCGQGRETLLFMEENLVSSETVERFRMRRRGGGASAALTLLLWQQNPPIMPTGEQVFSRLLAERDGQIAFSRALAKRSIWPAIDPLASTSRLLDERFVGVEHVRVARAAQELLRSYGDTDIGGTAGADLRLRGRAQRVLLFQSQPFYVAETFTGLPGEYVPVAETVRGFGELVDGLHDDVSEEVLRFAGALDQALGKAAI
jgi:F-type H+/Na+-transporting ATPase subunit beta